MPDLRLDLQPGLAYVGSEWPIDDLFGMYLRDDAPERLTFLQQAVWIELRGVRGEFHIRRMPQGDYVFRQSLQARHSLGDAAELAFGADPGFHPQGALTALLVEGLAVAMHREGANA
jgi:hypothetical protein